MGRIAVVWLLLPLLLLLPGGAWPQGSCPPAFLAAGEVGCRLLDEGALHSKQQNPQVLWRRYRLIEAGGEDSREGGLFPPIGLLLSIPGEGPIFAKRGFAGDWFELPRLIDNGEEGELLLLRYRVSGTGAFLEDYLFVARDGRWVEVEALQDRWAGTLQERLPKGYGLWKGIPVDYSTLTGASAVWRPGDANCCPTGGRISFKLAIRGVPPRLVVVAADYDRRGNQP